MIYDFNPYDFFTDFNRTAVEKYKEELTNEFQKIDEELFQYIRKANPTYKPKGHREKKTDINFWWNSVKFASL